MNNLQVEEFKECCKDRDSQWQQRYDRVFSKDKVFKTKKQQILKIEQELHGKVKSLVDKLNEDFIQQKVADQLKAENEKAQKEKKFSKINRRKFTIIRNGINLNFIGMDQKIPEKNDEIQSKHKDLIKRSQKQTKSLHIKRAQYFQEKAAQIQQNFKQTKNIIEDQHIDNLIQDSCRKTPTMKEYNKIFNKDQSEKWGFKTFNSNRIMAIKQLIYLLKFKRDENLSKISKRYTSIQKRMKDQILFDFKNDEQNLLDELKDLQENKSILNKSFDENLKESEFQEVKKFTVKNSDKLIKCIKDSQDNFLRKKKSKSMHHEKNYMNIMEKMNNDKGYYNNQSINRLQSIHENIDIPQNKEQIRSQISKFQGQSFKPRRQQVFEQRNQVVTGLDKIKFMCLESYNIQYRHIFNQQQEIFKDFPTPQQEYNQQINQIKELII